MNKHFNAWIVTALVLGLLVWVLILNCEVRRELAEMIKVRDDAKLTLHTFNMRKSDLWVKVWENQRDMYWNRGEIAKVRAIMIPPEYHITLVPLLVPDKLHVPKGMLDPANLPKPMFEKPPKGGTK